MVYKWGMGDSGFLGNTYAFGIYNPWWGGTWNISEATKAKLDEDVQKILNKCLKDVEEILTREKELFEYFAQELMKKGEIEYDEIVEIFRKHGKERPQDYTL
jgi:ATP-dependent Zn protease